MRFTLQLITITLLLFHYQPVEPVESVTTRHSRIMKTNAARVRVEKPVLGSLKQFNHQLLNDFPVDLTSNILARVDTSVVLNLKLASKVLFQNLEWCGFGSNSVINLIQNIDVVQTVNLSADILFKVKRLAIDERFLENHEISSATAPALDELIIQIRNEQQYNVTSVVNLWLSLKQSHRNLGRLNIYWYGLNVLASTIRHEDTSLSEKLLTNGIDPNSASSREKSPLHECVDFAQFQTAQILIQSGAHVNAVDNNGQTPLMVAVTKQREYFVKLFIKYGADLDVMSLNGENAVILAAYYKFWSIVQTLIEAGARVDSKNEEGRSLLMLALETDQLELAIHLIRKGASITAPDSFGNSALSWALHLKNQYVIEEMFKYRLDLDPYGHTAQLALDYAVKRGDLEMLAKLLRLKVPVNTVNDQGMSPLNVAMIYNHPEIVIELIKHKADPLVTYNGLSNTKLALKHHAYAASDALLSAVCGWTRQHLTILIDLMMRNNIRLFDTCARLGLNTEFTDEQGRTAIMYASYYGKLDFAKILVDAHCNVNAQDINGVNALMYASLAGHVPVIHFLVSNGASVHSMDNLKRTALFYAVSESQTDAMHALVSAGAEINARDSAGETALISAIRHGQYSIIHDLLLRGSDIKAKDVFEMDAIDHAKLSKNDNLLDYLRQQVSGSSTRATKFKEN